MPTFGDILSKIQREDQISAFDRVRREIIAALHAETGRNVVVYYSGWLQKIGPQFFYSTQINDEDKHGFMATFAGLDFDKGLDLVLHTPGGDVAATESIIDYLRSKFVRDIRVIVPQISMSGGTMIALAAKEIVMGRHSNLGPIDPQIGGRPAIAILEEFAKARSDIAANPATALLWQPILQQYTPTLLSSADQAIKWTREIGAKALREGLFFGDPDAEKKANDLVDFLISHDLHRAHGRHLHRSELSQRGLNIVDLEANPTLQDAVLSVHHACMLTVGNGPAVKLIENHKGVAHVKIAGQVQIPIQMQMPQQPLPVAPQPNVPQPQPPPAPPGPPVQPAPTSPLAAEFSPRRKHPSLRPKKIAAKTMTAKRTVRKAARAKKVAARPRKRAVKKSRIVIRRQPYAETSREE